MKFFFLLHFNTCTHACHLEGANSRSELRDNYHCRRGQRPHRWISMGLSLMPGVVNHNDEALDEQRNDRTLGMSSL